MTMADTVACKSEDISHHDDSGTDALYIALDDTNHPSAETPIKEEDPLHNESVKDEKVATGVDLSKSSSSINQPPVITEYPRPYLPSLSLPPLPTGYFPFHPMFLPAMMQAQYPMMPAHPTIGMTHQHENHRGTLEKSYETMKTEFSPSPTHYEDGRTSPADSLSSSGVSSCSSPLRASPELSPKTPQTYARTPGGRTSYAPSQVRAMEKLFSENRYPDYDQLEKMSSDLSIPIKKIKVWFQNKRARTKSRYPEMSMNGMTTMIPQVPAYGFPGYPMMPIPISSPMMPPYPIHPLQMQHQSYLC